MQRSDDDRRELAKALQWWDGFVIGLANPGFLIGSLAFSVGILGGWGAAALWAVSVGIGALAAWIYSELGAMFPDKPGGIAFYAHEGWRRVLSLVGPVAGFGYWFAWSSGLAIFGLLIGSLAATLWFPGQDWTVSTGIAEVGLPHLVGGAFIVLVWLVNVYGIRPSMRTAYVTAALLLVPVAVLIALPLLTGEWESSNLTWSLDGDGQDWGGWKTALVWLFIMGWSAYGMEIPGVFAPEYKRGARDVSLALRSCALFTVAIYLLLPLATAGTAGQEAADRAVSTGNPAHFFVPAFERLVGDTAADVLGLLLIGGLVLVMNTVTGDGSRALYSIAREGMTIRQLDHLNRHAVPARAMTLDLVANLLLLFFVGDMLAILFAANVGYILAHVFALTGFLLLRQAAPAHERPVRLGRIWLPIAGVLAAANLVFLAVAFSDPGLAAYGGSKERWIAVAVLLSPLVLFAYRRKVQDRAIPVPEDAPALPLAEREGAS